MLNDAAGLSPPLWSSAARTSLNGSSYAFFMLGHSFRCALGPTLSAADGAAGAAGYCGSMASSCFRTKHALERKCTLWLLGSSGCFQSSANDVDGVAWRNSLGPSFFLTAFVLGPNIAVCGKFKVFF